MFMMRSRVSPQEILTTLMTNIVIAKNKDHTKSLSTRFVPQYRRQNTLSQYVTRCVTR